MKNTITNDEIERLEKVSQNIIQILNDLEDVNHNDLSYWSGEINQITRTIRKRK